MTETNKASVPPYRTHSNSGTMQILEISELFEAVEHFTKELTILKQLVQMEYNRQSFSHWQNQYLPRLFSSTYPPSVTDGCQVIENSGSRGNIQGLTWT